MCITEYNEVQHLENVKREGIEQGIEQGRTSIFNIQDYIIDNPNETDSEVEMKFRCKETLVKEARKRIK